MTSPWLGSGNGTGSVRHSLLALSGLALSGLALSGLALSGMLCRTEPAPGPAAAGRWSWFQHVAPVGHGSSPRRGDEPRACGGDGGITGPL